MSGAVLWVAEFDSDAARELRKLGSSERQRILKFLRERLATEDDPRRLGAILSGPFSGLWRYRVGDYRLIAAIEDDRATVLILRVGHRREVYR